MMTSVKLKGQNNPKLTHNRELWVEEYPLLPTRSRPLELQARDSTTAWPHSVEAVRDVTFRLRNCRAILSTYSYYLGDSMEKAGRLYRQFLIFTTKKFVLIITEVRNFKL